MRHRERPGSRSLMASAAVHVFLLVVAWVVQATQPDPLDFVTFQVDIVSPPPAREAEVLDPPPPQEELVVETPDPTPPPEEPEPDPVVEEDPVREEEKPDPTPTPPPPAPEEEEAGDPEPAEELSGEDINVRMEGLRQDFPDYYQNIIRQMNRCMRFRGPGGLKTSVYFEIRRDGSVAGSGIRFVARSGNAGFDFAVMEAVECAANGRFGPLPEELGWDRMPIIFDMTSSRRSPVPRPGDPPGHHPAGTGPHAEGPAPLRGIPGPARGVQGNRTLPESPNPAGITE